MTVELISVRRIPDRSARLFSLDLLRGVAVLLVLIRHVPPQPEWLVSPREFVFPVLQSIGWTGVDLFFVLSGFLIANLLLREVEETGKIRVWRFLGRRSFKIWPSYFAAYGSIVVLWCLRDSWRGDWLAVQETLWNAVPNSLFVQNYVSCELWPHSWSLAVEEHFYLLLPLLMATSFSRQTTFDGIRVAQLGLCVAAVISVAVLAIRYRNQSVGLSWHANYYPSHVRFDSLLFGVALAGVFRYVPDVKRSLGWWLPVGLVLLLAGLTTAAVWPLTKGGPSSVWGMTLLFLGYGALVLAAALYPEWGQRPSLGVISALTRSLAWIGVYSYTIYLAHACLFAVPGVASIRDAGLRGLHDSLGFSGHFLVWMDRGLFMALSIAGGVLLSLAVERPFLRLRSRWLPASSCERNRGHNNCAISGQETKGLSAVLARGKS